MAMQSINISSYTDPSRYQLSELPKPELGSADDVIIKVHAASINPIDVKRTAGALKMAMRDA
jgi:NADPH:quinone reductase-like Zn-dependent oxidoreductase